MIWKSFSFHFIQKKNGKPTNTLQNVIIIIIIIVIIIINDLTPNSISFPILCYKTKHQVH